MNNENYNVRQSTSLKGEKVSTQKISNSGYEDKTFLRKNKDMIAIFSIFGLISLLMMASCTAVIINLASEPSSQPTTSSTQTESNHPSAQVNNIDEEALAGTISLDTSMFDQIAEKVDLTDSREITQYISLGIYMKQNGNTPSLATQQALTQAYYFIKNNDLTGADRVAFYIIQNNNKIFQVTVDMSKFITSDDGKIINLILDAGKVEKVLPEIIIYGRELGWHL